MDNDEEKNKKHIEKVYADKASNLLNICIAILVFSGITYIIALLDNSFDFGLILEIISFIFIIMANDKIATNKLTSAKTNIIISMIPIGALLIFDFGHLITNLGEVSEEVIEYYTGLDKYFYHIEPYLADVTLILTFVLLFKAYFSLNKADGTATPTNDYVDTFYDKL